MLALEDVSLVLGEEEQKVNVLAHVSLTFERSKIYALTGPNGGGKTSVARVIMGIYRPTAGRVLFDGRDITALGITERSRLGIGYAFQHPVRFKGFKVGDLLEIALRGGEASACGSLREIGLCPDEYLARELDGSLSGGEMKRIEIATLLARQPLLRIFDEPEAGIDLWSFEQLIKVIASSHRPDTATVIISHQEKILNMADEIILIAGGAVRLQGGRETVWPQIRDSALCRCRQNCPQEGEDFAQCPR